MYWMALKTRTLTFTTHPRWLHVIDAPLPWLLDLHHQAIHNFLNGVFVVATFTGLCHLQLYVPSESAQVVRKIASSFVSSGIVAVTCSYMARKLPKGDSLLQKYVLATLMFLVMAPYTSLVVQHEVIRNRVLVFLSFLPKMFPALLGIRMRACRVLVAWSMLHDMGATFLSARLHQDIFIPRYYFFVCIVNIVWLACMGEHHNTLRKLYDTEQELQAQKRASAILVLQLEAEKNASETLVEQLKLEKKAVEMLMAQIDLEREAATRLLSMVCDSSVWLSGDGDTIIRSDNGFEAIVGAGAQGERLSNYILSEERERFRVFVSDIERLGSRVGLLHTCLVSPSGIGEANQVDLFLVDRQQGEASLSVGAGSPMPSYLVGLRMSSAVGSGVDASSGAEADVPFASDAFVLACAGAPAVTDMSEVSSMVGEVVCEKHAVQSFPMEARREAAASIAAATETFARSCKPFPSVALHTKPPPCTQFRPSSSYLRHVIMSVLQDLAECTNFQVISCCPWHSALLHLQQMCEDLGGVRKCPEWRPSAVRQCWKCSALIDTEAPEEPCWLCNESQAAVSASR